MVVTVRPEMQRRLSAREVTKDVQALALGAMLRPKSSEKF